MRVLRGIFPVLALGAALSWGSAQAQEAIDNPGRLLASNCFQCHGTNGMPVAGGFDRLAGETTSELVSELQEMRAEAIATSEHPIMTVHAQTYSLAEIDLMARYLAGVSASTPGAFSLSVTKAGAGRGTVTSSPYGISCGSTCLKSYSGATTVVLTAAASSGSVFTGWSGACSGTSTRCTVAVDSAKSVVATFGTATAGGTGTTQYIVKVEKAGKYYGSITSAPAGIACGLGCEKASMKAAKGATVTLTAKPGTGRKFVGWAGACLGTAPVCTLTLSQNREVKATFK